MAEPNLVPLANYREYPHDHASIPAIMKKPLGEIATFLKGELQLSTALELQGPECKGMSREDF